MRGGGRGSHGSGPGSARPWDLLFLGGPRHKGRGPGGQARTGVLDTRVWVPGTRQTLEPGGVCCHSAHSTECADHCQQEAQCPWTPPTLHPSSGPFPGPPQPGPDGRVGPPCVVAVRSCCCLGFPVRPRAVGAVPVTACPVLGGAPGSAVRASGPGQLGAGPTPPPRGQAHETVGGCGQALGWVSRGGRRHRRVDPDRSCKVQLEAGPSEGAERTSR